MKKEQDYYDSFDEKSGNGFLVVGGIIFGVFILIISIIELTQGQIGWFVFLCMYVIFLSIVVYINKKSSKLSNNFIPSNKTKEQLMDEYVIKNKIKEQQLEQARRYQVNVQAQELLNKPKCPTCGSTNIRKIGGIERGASIGAFGIFSKKINKTFKCNNCGYTW